MAESTTYQCPNCEGRLVFDAPSGKMVCEFCVTTFDPLEIEQRYAAEQAHADAAATREADKAQAAGAADSTNSASADTKSRQNANDDPIQAYLNSTKWNGNETNELRSVNCSSCGALLIADDTTAVTQCPYCGNTAVVPGQLADMFKPDYVIPFKLDKNAAVSTLKDYYKDKKLLPKSFAGTNHVEEIQGVYVPFWLYSGNAHGALQTEAHNTRRWEDKDNTYVATDHYSVYREGTMDFAQVPVDGSSRMPDAHMDSIEPFDYSEMVPFSVAYLPGFVADRYDVGVDECAKRAERRIEATCSQALLESVEGYESVDSKPADVSLSLGTIAYALLPVWMLHTRWNDQDFLFAMNGQSGRLMGDLPIDKGKAVGSFFKWFVSFVVICAFAVYFLLGDLTSDWIVSLLAILGLPALIAGLVLHSQITAMRPVKEQEEAGAYLDRESVNIIASRDDFINTTMTTTPRANAQNMSKT